MFFDFFILIARLRLATSYIMELVRRSSPTPPVRVLVVFWAERGFSTRVGSLSLADDSGLIRSHIRSHCHDISFVSALQHLITVPWPRSRQYMRRGGRGNQIVAF